PTTACNTPCPAPQRPQLTANRDRHPRLEPAHAAAADAGQHNAALPGLAEYGVETREPPGREQVGRRAAPDVDDILIENDLTEVLNLPAEQPQVRRQTAVDGERIVEANDVVVRVAARRGHEANLRR